jgi:hypothetical protein
MNDISESPREPSYSTFFVQNAPYEEINFSRSSSIPTKFLDSSGKGERVTLQEAYQDFASSSSGGLLHSRISSMS